MDIRFLPGKLDGKMDAPASKSEAHRRMICAGLTPTQTELKGFMISEDTRATARCLEALGATVSLAGDTLSICGFENRSELMPVFDCGESGSTLRFFVPLALILRHGGVFRMRGRLSQRPMEVYKDLFVPHGVSWHMSEGADGAAELMVAGSIPSGEYILPGNVSSQFVSGLLFSLPLLKGDSNLRVLPPVESGGYIRMTVTALQKSGIRVEEIGEYAWHIPGFQQYQSESSELHGDWSQAAVLLCADALGSNVTLTHLNTETVQGDAAILGCLEKMGATVHTEGGIRVEGGKLHGQDLDMHDYPDIVPMLALVCQLAEGESRLRNCGRLRLKECDRLAGTVSILNSMGGQAHEEGDDLVIQGVSKLKSPGFVETYHDHRMVMLASIAALVCDGPVEVRGADALDKSWPEYISVYRSLGGKAE